MTKIRLVNDKATKRKKKPPSGVDTATAAAEDAPVKRRPGRPALPPELKKPKKRPIRKVELASVSKKAERILDQIEKIEVQYETARQALLQELRENIGGPSFEHPKTPGIVVTVMQRGEIWFKRQRTSEQE